MKIHSNKKLLSWINTARIETIPLSISGIIIGSFYSFYLNKFDIIIFLLAILTAISYQVLSNFANDYGDGILGTDDNRIGPKRSIASGQISVSELKKGIIISVFISISLSYFLIKYSFGTNYYLILVFLLLSILSVTAAIKYTIGKTPYGYKGFGDIFVFIFFGLISVMGSSFLFIQYLEFKILFLAISLGLLCVGVLNLNNIRDIENDSKMNKRTLATRLGFKYSKFYHYLLISISIIFTIIWSLDFPFSFGHLLIFISLVPLLAHIYNVYIASNSLAFKPLLKQLALSTFLYSILIAFFLVNESNIF